MPRKPIEWSKCIIYKIWKDDDFYVGSTTDFTNRKRQHKQSCNNKGKGYNYKIYQTIREKGGWTAWQMTPLEEYKECQTQVQARIREEEWRVKIQANLNSRKCFGAETRQEYVIQYQQENKEQIAEKNKEYYNVNKEKMNKNSKEYAQINKEQIIEKRKGKYECVCGSTLCKGEKTRHEKTKKHISFISK